MTLASTIAQASTNAYVSLLKVKASELSKVSIVIGNLHATRVIKWKVVVSNDEAGAAASFTEEKSEATLAGATTVKYALSAAYEWVDIQIASNEADSPANSSVWLKGV